MRVSSRGSDSPGHLDSTVARPAVRAADDSYRSVRGADARVGARRVRSDATPFFALEQGGRLVDLYRGANLAEVLAPPTGERTSPYGDLAILGGLALFASLGGVRLALGVFAEGFVTLPVGATPATSFGALSLDAAKALTSALTFAAVSAMPAAISIMVAELALGLVARAVPKISVFFLGMPLRAMLGLALGLLSVGVVLDRAVTEAEVAARSAGRVLR